MVDIFKDCVLNGFTVDDMLKDGLLEEPINWDNGSILAYELKPLSKYIYISTHCSKCHKLTQVDRIERDNVKGIAFFGTLCNSCKKKDEEV
jgi:hypothetical protein